MYLKRTLFGPEIADQPIKPKVDFPSLVLVMSSIVFITPFVSVLMKYLHPPDGFIYSTLGGDKKVIRKRGGGGEDKKLISVH